MLSFLADQLLKLFIYSFLVRNLYVEKIQPAIKAMLDFFRMSKIFTGQEGVN